MEFNEYGFSSYPDFSIIYNSRDHSHYLDLPKSHRKYYPTPLPNFVLLKKPEGGFWKVRWSETGDHGTSFESVWLKFVVDNGILDGDRLLFTYDGSRVFFWVRVYRDGVLVKTVSPVNIEEFSDDEDETSDDDDDDDDDDEEEEEDAMIYEVKKAFKEFCQRRGKGVSSEVARPAIIKDPKRYLDDPENPYFFGSSSRCPVLVINRAVRVPPLSYGHTIKLIDSFGKWERELRERKNGQLVVCKWDEVYERNDAKPGDAIICEILHKRGVVHSMKVHFIQ